MLYLATKTRRKLCRINQIALRDPGSEKAGVGGSIPSLATMFSIVRTGHMGNRLFLRHR